MKPFTFPALALVCFLAPAARAVPVTITVLGPDNEPLPNATLSVVEAPAYIGDANALPIREVPGAGGRFQFERASEFSTADPNGMTPDERRKMIILRALVTAPGMTTQTRLIERANSTIHLQSGRSWGGVLLDGAGQPVAGAAIELGSWRVPSPAANKARVAGQSAPEAPEFLTFVPAWKRRALTDAAGRWRFDDLPARGQINLEVADPRFVARSFDLDLSEADEATPLFVNRGGTVTGVLRAPGGAPIADATVRDGSSNRSLARTDAAGRFSVMMNAGQAKLRVGRDEDNRDPAYIVPKLENVRVVVGQTTDVGTWQAQQGVTLGLIVVDAQTKKPVKGAWVFFGGDSSISPTDAQGRAQGRVLPDGWRDSNGTIGAVDADGYFRADVVRPNLEKGATTLDLGIVELRPGTVLTGVARAQGETQNVGRLPDVLLRKGENSMFERLSTQGNGQRFTSRTLEPGTYPLALDINGKTKAGGWEIVSPKALTVPAKTTGQIAAPDIVLRRLPDDAAGLQTVSGRVLDEQGRGVSGAVISFDLHEGNGSTSARATSRDDGSFEAPINEIIAPDSLEFTGIERPGYLFAGTPSITLDGARAKVSDITLKKRGAVFSGRVLDENGAAAVGAWVVALEARGLAPVQTGADGSFALRDVPLDKFTLMAAKGFTFARTDATLSAPGVALKLGAPPAPDREALAAQALEGTPATGDFIAYWDVLGTDRMEKIVSSKRAYFQVGAFLTELGKRDPQYFLKRAPALLDDLTVGERALFEARIVQRRAALAGAWLDAQKADKREVNAQSVTRLLQMFAVAKTLGRVDARDTLDYAAAIAAQLGNIGNEARAWSAELAPLGYEESARFVEALKPRAEFNFWMVASAQLAELGDGAGAKRALARLQTLVARPELAGDDKNWNTPARQLETARDESARALARTDAAGALELWLESTDRRNHLAALLVIAERALDAGQTEVAERALREVFQQQTSWVEKYALAASLAQQLDPKLGAQLWAEALARSVPDDESSGPFAKSVGPWAFYHARLDPAQSRVLIENEWSWRWLAIQNKAGERKPSAETFDKLALGMAAVDLARALEMRREIAARIREAGQQPADLALAAATLATQAQRARLGIGTIY